MTVSSSRIIPKEQAGDLKRWEISPFAPRVSPREAEAARAAQRDRGYAEGYAAGERAGLEAAGRVSAAESARLATLLASASAAMDTLGSRVARETVELAVAIARQVVRRELRADPKAIIPIVEEAMAVMSSEATGAQLHLHPMDAALIRQHIGDELTRNRWRIVEDERMNPGGCRLSASCGDIDATLDTRWGMVLAAIERPMEAVDG